MTLAKLQLVSNKEGDRTMEKKSFNIYVREKRSKQNICIMWF